MNNFFFVGHIAKMTELGPDNNNALWIQLIRTEQSEGPTGQQLGSRQVRIEFLAYEQHAEFIRLYAKVGSLLNIEASVQNSSFTDEHGVVHAGHTFKLQLVGLGSSQRTRRVNVRPGSLAGSAYGVPASCDSDCSSVPVLA